ncbi:NAD(P)-dependent oxidoreductase [Glutamicibacter sp.]|uniref:NAD(P)-dependent oxidoreductase n=1 Tax=Glutamicibacter sp. TaxID=1931995 RepID=UPI0037BE424B
MEQALERGHEVIAVARNTQGLSIQHQDLRIETASILNLEAISPLLSGVDSVISCVGIGTSKEPTTLYSQGTRNLIAGMNEHDVSRLIVISSEVVDQWSTKGWLKRCVVFPLLQKFLGATYDDMRRMDVVLWESGVRWTSVRSPRITAAVPKNGYRFSAEGPLKNGWQITAPDMANALLDLAERDDVDRRQVYVAN